MSSVTSCSARRAEQRKRQEQFESLAANRLERRCVSAWELAQSLTTRLERHRVGAIQRCDGSVMRTPARSSANMSSADNLEWPSRCAMVLMMRNCSKSAATSNRNSKE